MREKACRSPPHSEREEALNRIGRGRVRPMRPVLDEGRQDQEQHAADHPRPTDRLEDTKEAKECGVGIENLPADLLAGRDAQLETAVAELMRALAAKPGGLTPPPAFVPAYPDNGIVAPKP